jgi:flagellar hook assembly protein FlgD
MPTAGPTNIPVVGVSILSGSVFNPLNGGSVSVGFEVKEPADVKVIVYNRNGRLIRTLVTSRKAAGTYTANWNGTFTDGKVVSAGIYVIYVSIDGAETKLKVAVKK